MPHSLCVSEFQWANSQRRPIPQQGSPRSHFPSALPGKEETSAYIPLWDLQNTYIWVCIHGDSYVDVCMYITHTYIHTSMWMWMHIHVYMWMYIHICVYYIYRHLCVNIHTNFYVLCIHVDICAYMHTDIYHICIYMYIHEYAFIYPYTYITKQIDICFLPAIGDRFPLDSDPLYLERVLI